MVEISVVNIRNEKCDVKCCRTPDNKIPAPPEQGCLGNPFFLKDESDRDEVVSLYRDYFYKKISYHEGFRDYVHSLMSKAKDGVLKLGCFCAPKACHVDIIKEYLEENCNE